VLTLVGAINLPIIKFSVDWWNTLHQPASVFRIGGPTIDLSMLMPLAVMAIAFTLLFIALHLAAMRNEILRRRVRTLMLTQAERAAKGAGIMALGRHAGFSVGAYITAPVVIAGFVVWVPADSAAQKRALTELERRGIPRRSAESRPLQIKE